MIGVFAGAVPGVTGTVAVVTGAGRGIGAAYAQTLGAAGASVACLDIDEPSALQVASEIVSAGGTALGIRADVTDDVSLGEAAATVASELGPTRHLIANAGILGPMGPTADVDLDHWKSTLDVNVTGVFLSVKLFADQVRSQAGTIMLASSVAGLRGWTDMIAYHASKHAVIGLMRCWANEYAADGVRVNAVCPGWVETAMIGAQAEAAGLSADEAEALWTTDQLIERFVQPQEVANAVVWVCSDWASMIQAVVLPVDGGLVERTNR